MTRRLQGGQAGTKTQLNEQAVTGYTLLLFFEDNTRMLYGDAQKVAQALISGVKSPG